ncbi:MAG: putative nucleic acid-binding Zn-ribbon protein [Alloalcanivorax venustensis]|jgi:predicted  nucleic acid-binding Zn-ribbon protein|tara:strand:+ start:82020 stop:82316 length:297 start_codon:yes stop_codon:yes gene_type:complete
MPLGTRLFTAVPFPKEATMSDRRTENDYESDDLLMNDDFELEDGVDDDLQEEKAARSRSFNMDMRHRIEDRLEERRLKRELGDYEFFDMDDDDEDILH